MYYVNCTLYKDLGPARILMSRCFIPSLQSECRIVPLKHSDENIVLQAVMDEFDEHREKGNLTAELLNREKVRKVQHLYPIRSIHYLNFICRKSVSKPLNQSVERSTPTTRICAAM